MCSNSRGKLKSTRSSFQTESPFHTFTESGSLTESTIITGLLLHRAKLGQQNHHRARKKNLTTFLLLSPQERKSTTSTFGSKGRSEQQILKKEPPFGRPNSFYLLIQFYSGNTPTKPSISQLEFPQELTTNGRCAEGAGLSINSTVPNTSERLCI